MLLLAGCTNQCIMYGCSNSKNTWWIKCTSDIQSTKLLSLQYSQWHALLHSMERRGDEFWNYVLINYLISLGSLLISWTPIQIANARKL